MAWLKKRWWIVATVVGVVAAAVVLLLFVFPGGSPTPGEAMLAHVEGRSPDDGTARVLVEEPWGDGQLVLARYESGGEPRLGLGFASETMRGWRVASYTEQPASPDDVAVGSLLVASSPAGAGQPEWSAAVGELSDGRIDRVEVEWSSGERSSTERTNDAYLVVIEGSTEPTSVRYLTEDDIEIAEVPAGEQ